MRSIVEVVVAYAFVGVLVGFGALLYWLIADRPTERERALEAKIDALTRANRLGASYFNAQAEMREEMARSGRASVRSASVGSASVGRARVGSADFIEGEWR
ncbi:hypothetical protein [Micromonospora sp. NBC_01796]|uniref:hypothetical protein n=1 Tax=Micromonospora sp. NBC_01796 TaxID=2975987 RepID=UPI002DDAEBA4|nr:hypothetical protein [Micromonospora sp. NBC_01796]WSA86711.1 hypothetical protein OIE47_03535 [Micromonospora sp. NBC_01796]